MPKSIQLPHQISIQGRTGDWFLNVKYPKDFLDRDRFTAVKRIAPRRFKENFTDIETVMKQLNHPNIRRLFHIEEDDEYKYYILELCEFSLIDYYKMSHCEPAYKDLSQMANGLAYIHSLKLVHGALSSCNILCVYDENRELVWKIADFGFLELTKPKHGQQTIILSHNQNRNFLWYKAPELKMLLEFFEPNHVGPPNTYNPSSDVFALGIIFYEFFTKGSHPFEEGDDSMTLKIRKGVYNLNGKNFELY